MIELKFNDNNQKTFEEELEELEEKIELVGCFINFCHSDV